MLKQYFNQLKSLINKYNIQLSNTWNMNEIDFRIECERSRLMIILIIKQSSSRMINSNNRKYIIFVKVINVVDNIIISFLIFKKIFIAHRLIVNDLNWTITLIISETTYSNDDLIMN